MPFLIYLRLFRGLRPLSLSSLRIGPIEFLRGIAQRLPDTQPPPGGGPAAVGDGRDRKRMLAGLLAPTLTTGFRAMTAATE
jgi:hypothetical protein